jgi:4-amino-4-deoxy-L-arabinose transferase-like glycosyltransferase
LPEVFLSFLIALAVWLYTRTLEKDRKLSQRHIRAASGDVNSNTLPKPPSLDHGSVIMIAAACGAVAGLAALAKPNIAAFCFILAGSTLLALRRNRRRAVAVAGVIVLAAAVVMGPWALRNWITFGRPFLSNAGLGYIARVTAPATRGVVEGHRVLPWSPEWETRYHELVTQAASRFDWAAQPTRTLSPREADQREQQIARVAWDIVKAYPGQALQAHLVGFVRSWAPQEQTFWYTHLSGRRWEETGIGANRYRDAVEIFFAGRPIEALEFAVVEPWTQLDALGAALWYGWGMAHLIGGCLMMLGVWRLRHHPAIALAMGLTILYATFPPGPIGYVRFRVPVVPVITVLEVAGLVFLANAACLFRSSKVE